MMTALKQLQNVRRQNADVLISDTVRLAWQFIPRRNKDGENVAVTAMPPIIGLTKEQLEEFRSYGFYKSLRYILFALFWVIWIAPNIYQTYVFGFNDANADGFGDFNGRHCRFYGDEYGLRNTVAQSDLDEQLGHMLWLHADGANNGFSSLADDLLVKPLQSASEHEAVTETILKRFKGLSNLRSRLRHGVTFVGKNAIVRGNRDNSFYALFFNDQPTTETIEFSKMIPSDVAELLKSTTEITLDGADGSVMSDLSEATQKLPGYGYHIVKLHG